MLKNFNGVFHQVNIDNLGEFKFLFTNKGNKYYLESYWNPENYGESHFIVGYEVDDIEKEISKIKEDMSYFIDGARIACECKVEAEEDIDGVYEGILDSYFAENDDSDECDSCCECCNCEEDEMTDEDKAIAEFVGEMTDKVLSTKGCPHCVFDLLLDLYFTARQHGFDDCKVYVKDMLED
jgi:hypothetical protein